MVKFKKDKLYNMYPKPALNLDKFYNLSIGETVITRYMGPGIVIHPPVRYKHDNGITKIYRNTALIKLTRACWKHWDETEFPFYELTTNSYAHGGK